MEHAIWISIVLYSSVLWIKLSGAFTNNVNVNPVRSSWQDRLDALRRQLQEEQHRFDVRRQADARIKAAIEAENRLRQEEFLRHRKASVLKSSMASAALNELAWTKRADDTVPNLSESTFEELENIYEIPILLETMTTSIVGPAENIWNTFSASDRNTLSNTTTHTNQVLTTVNARDVMFESAAVLMNESDSVKTKFAAATSLPITTTGSIDPLVHKESAVVSTIRPLVIASKDTSVVEPAHVSNESNGGNRTINITDVTRSLDSQKDTNKHELGATRQPSSGTSRLIPASLIDLVDLRGAPISEPSVTAMTTTSIPRVGRVTFTTGQELSVSNETVNTITSGRTRQHSETMPSSLDDSQSIHGILSTTENPWDNPDFFGPLGIAVFENVTIPGEVTTPALAARPGIVSRFLLDLSQWFISQRNGNP